jgi:predicted NBD/HSP70 family sugar kinase
MAFGLHDVLPVRLLQLYLLDPLSATIRTCYTKRMYLGIDVGGTKTLVGLIDKNGVIHHSQRFPTPVNYDDFLKQLSETVANMSTDDFEAVALGVPATHLDRIHGIGKRFGNLPWRDVELRDDLAELFSCPAAVENDAKLACLSESMLRKDRAGVLYVTISTGIGYAFCRDQKIDTNIGDGGGALLMLEYGDKLVPWERFASGHAIVERFGKKAADITDDATWQRIAHDLSMGFLELIAITEPDVIVVGGSVGNYFERLKPHLETALKRQKIPLLDIPPMEKATRPEEAVLYGCYDLIQGVYGRHRQHITR